MNAPINEEPGKETRGFSKEIPSTKPFTKDEIQRFDARYNKELKEERDRLKAQNRELLEALKTVDREFAARERQFQSENPNVDPWHTVLSAIRRAEEGK